MQNYENKPEVANPFKEFVLEVLDILRYKLENDCLSVSDWEALARIIGERLPLLGSLDELSDYFGQSKNNVKVVINRKMIAKPVRRILYPFTEFIKVLPASWKLHKKR